MKKLKTVFLFFFLIMLSSQIVYSQNRDSNKSFKVYIRKNLYNNSVKNYISNNSIFRGFHLVTVSMFDPQKIGEINLKVLKHYLEKFYPSKADSGVLCLDIENNFFKDLRDNNASSTKFKIAVDTFRTVLKFVKEFRPNVKVGLYGIPFKVYYNSQEKYNTGKKLDSVLTLADIIFPSFYIAYPNVQKGENSNIEYLKKNLEIAFSYASRLDKPVIPFLWYLIHPSNNKYGLQIIPVKQMKQYYDYIKYYKSTNGATVAGIVWWDTPTPFQNHQIKQAFIQKQTTLNINNTTNAFLYYKDIFK